MGTDGMGKHAFPLCRTGGMTNSGTKYRETSDDVTCRVCATFIDGNASNNGEKEEMAAKEDKAAKEAKWAELGEKITACIERIKPLAIEGNTDAAQAIFKDEVEMLIPQITGEGAMAERKRWRALAEAALEAKPEITPSSEVATAPQAAEVASLETRDYHDIEGVSEMVANATATLAEGIEHQRAATSLAKQLAASTLTIGTLMTNPEGNPDLRTQSQGFRDMMTQIVADALVQAGYKEGDKDTARAAKKLGKSIAYQRGNLRVKYIRTLADTPEEREKFGRVLEAFPNHSVEDAIFEYYNLDSASELEKTKEREDARRALASASLAELTAAIAEPDMPADYDEDHDEEEEDQEDAQKGGGEPIVTPGEKTPRKSLFERLSEAAVSVDDKFTDFEDKVAKQLDPKKLNKVADEDVAALEAEIATLKGKVGALGMTMVAITRALEKAEKELKARKVVVGSAEASASGSEEGDDADE
jgi:hypothetical protein